MSERINARLSKPLAEFIGRMVGETGLGRDTRTNLNWACIGSRRTFISTPATTEGTSKLAAPPSDVLRVSPNVRGGSRAVARAREA